MYLKMYKRSFSFTIALIFYLTFSHSAASTENKPGHDFIFIVFLATAFMEKVDDSVFFHLVIDENKIPPCDEEELYSQPLSDDTDTIIQKLISTSYKSTSFLIPSHELTDGVCEIVPVFMINAEITVNNGASSSLSLNPSSSLSSLSSVSLSPPPSPDEQTLLTKSSTHKLYGMFGGGGGDGDGDGDGDDGYTSTEEYDDDDEIIEKQFNNLKKKVNQYKKAGTKCNKEFCSALKFRSQLHLFKELEQFAWKHPTYAVDAYKLALELPFAVAIRVGIAIPVIYGLAVDFGEASFHDLGISIPRALISTLRLMLKTVIPLVLNQGMDVLSLWGGITITSALDNAFAHLDNSSYALPWGSEESADYALRVIATTWINYIWLKQYKSSIIPLLARPLARLPKRAHHQFMLMTIDMGSTLFLSYLALALQVAGYPYLSLTVGPNPFGPAGVYPNPYCSPEVKWIFWGARCRAISNSTVVEEIEGF